MLPRAFECTRQPYPLIRTCLILATHFRVNLGLHNHLHFLELLDAFPGSSQLALKAREQCPIFTGHGKPRDEEVIANALLNYARKLSWPAAFEPILALCFLE